MKRLLTAALTIFLLTAAASTAWSCVGKTLQVGVVSRGEERLLGSILSILVNERTGTSVKIREFSSFRECFGALEKNDIDIVVSFMGQGCVEVLMQKSASSVLEAVENARRSFNERFNLVWLKTWGLTDGGRFMRDGSDRPLATEAAPLVRKETLKEFPALARLVDKMAGRLDNTIVQGLVMKMTGADADSVAREYLRAEKLI